MHFHETYLYKLHSLTTQLYKLFDRALLQHAGLSLSQFLLLMAVSQQDGINQRQVAKYLGVSPVAIKRQVDLAKLHRRIVTRQKPGRGDALHLTAAGKTAMQNGLLALEQHVFGIFDEHNQSLNLMSHINLLLDNVQEAQNQESARQAEDHKEE